MNGALEDLTRAFLTRAANGPALPGTSRARAAFAALGLPGPRSETWKYTPLLRALGAETFGAAPTEATVPAGLAERLPANFPRLVFINGRWAKALSSPDWPYLRRSIGLDLARVEREPLAALAAMLAEDGAAIHVPAGVDAGTLVLAHCASSEEVPASLHPRHALRLDSGSRLLLVELALGIGRYLHNPLLEIELGANAILRHVRLIDESPSAFHLGTLYATLGAGARYDGFSLLLGGRLTRAESHAVLAGAGGTAHLNAAELLRGFQHADVTTVISHDAPSCSSRQTVKSVLAGRARGVFQGRIEVARAAQKTDGYQMTQALLLSSEAEMDSKPELEIFADDVKCSHGATVGALDPEQLFYLRTRGIPEGEARAMLIHAFLDEALAVVEDEAARKLLDVAVESWWGEGAA